MVKNEFDSKSDGVVKTTLVASLFGMVVSVFFWNIFVYVEAPQELMNSIIIGSFFFIMALQLRTLDTFTFKLNKINRKVIRYQEKVNWLIQKYKRG